MSPTFNDAVCHSSSSDIDYVLKYTNSIKEPEINKESLASLLQMFSITILILIEA